MNSNNSDTRNMSKSMVIFHLESIEDLLRWMISSSKQHGTIFYSFQQGQHVYSTYINFPDYFEYRGLPVHAYCYHGRKPADVFIRYDIKDDLSKDERINFVSGFDESDSSLGYVQYFPVITLKNIPEMFKISD